MSTLNNIQREYTPLTDQESFLVFDRTKDFFDFPIHYHPEIELNFILGGKGVRRIIGDSIEEIEDLELVFVGADLVHGWEQHKCINKGIREVTLQFQQDLFNQKFLQRHLMKPLKDMFERSSLGILFSRETTEKVGHRLIKLSQLNGINYFMEILSILFELAQSKEQRMLSTNTIYFRNFENSDRIKLLHDYVQKNYSSKITLEDISRVFNMSNVSFNRFIKKGTGKTFVDYLNEVRIGHTTRFLVEKDLSISEIAYQSGFSSIANFNRVFKKIKGTTPKNYRRDFSGIKKFY